MEAKKKRLRRYGHLIKTKLAVILLFWIQCQNLKFENESTFHQILYGKRGMENNVCRVGERVG